MRILEKLVLILFNLTNDELAQMQHRMVVSEVLINKDDPTEKK